MPCTLGIFPHITQQEFEIACEKLIAAFRKCGPDEEKWSTVEIIHDFTSNYLRITTRPPFDTDNNQSATGIAETEINEQDDEAVSLCKSPIIMQYDTVLSPVYQVPVLYIDVVDPMHRFPPTMDTLYKYIIPEHYKSQAEHVGVIGGITIQHHPVTDKPMFFIHPCQTADLMTAVVKGKHIDATEYLMIWLSTMGKCVGLNVPLGLAKRQQEKHETSNA